MKRSPHIPLRTCVGCGKKGAKHQFIRVVKDRDGNIRVDRHHTAHGRGAYVCPNKSCVDSAKKTRGFNRSFKQIISESIYERIIAEIAE